MSRLGIAIALLVGGAVVTQIVKILLDRLHPPHGRFLDIAGLRQHVVDLGKPAGTSEHAPPIVLLHGAACNLEDMRPLGERLNSRHRVIMVDRPGLGWSERAGPQGNSPAYQAAILGGVLDRLAVDRAIVVGHSWGGAMATAFALDHPQRVAGLVVMASPTHPRLRRMTWFYMAAATPYAGWLFAQTLALPFGALFIGLGIRSAFLPQTPPRAYMRRTGPMLMLRPATFLANARDIAGLRSFLKAQVPRYGTLAVPTAVITGDRDLVVTPRRHAIPFAAAAPGARLEVWPGFGHMLHHAAADRIAEVIEDIAMAAVTSERVK
jgi:pimeloyl-ACP methyl ester carboxylesterase